MAKYNLAQLLRAVYLDSLKGNSSNKLYEELIKTIKNICKKEFNPLISDEVSNQLIFNIFKSFKSNNIWKKLSIDTDENNKIINEYFKKTKNTSFNEMNAFFVSKEEINLKSALRISLKDLVNEKFLIINAGKTYSLNNTNKKDLLTYTFPIPLFSILNKSGTLSSKKINIFIKNLFENYLENYRVSSSILLEFLIKSGGACKTESPKSFSDILEFNDTEGGYLEDLIVSNDGATSNLADINDISKTLIKNSKKNIKDSIYSKKAKAFFYKYYMGYNLDKISNLYNPTYSTSSIDDFIKEFIKSMEINSIISGEVDLIEQIINSVCELLNEEFHYENFN